MPISPSFAERLYPHLPDITAWFGTPFHIYDEQGIVEGAQRLNSWFDRMPGGFREYFAVKALPNMKILQILREQGFGFDCSSVPEVVMALSVGASGEDIMFTSNNTGERGYQAAISAGAILNLDDISFVSKVPGPFPDLICFRYNPGKSRSGNSIIGKPEEAKYGVRDDQIFHAYRLAIDRGATRFGLHSMIVSNQCDYGEMVKTISMLLQIVERLQAELGIRFEFINIGGGLGILYDPNNPEQYQFDLDSLAHESFFLLGQFALKNGYYPKLLMESGRWVTGPHGVLVTTIINKMYKHRKYVGVDASMSALMRPGMYGAYHHITIVGRDGREKKLFPAHWDIVDVVGALCENNDKFAVQRKLPPTVIGDFLVIHDTGAHGQAMGFNYNGQLWPAELLLRKDGSVELIRRPQTVDDYLATQDFTPQTLKLT